MERKMIVIMLLLHTTIVTTCKLICTATVYNESVIVIFNGLTAFNYLSETGLMKKSCIITYVHTAKETAEKISIIVLQELQLF